MHTSSSAKRTCRLSRSASLYTATVRIPSSRQARMTRRAISPRLAIRTFRNTSGPAVRWKGFGRALPHFLLAGRHPGDAEGELAGVRRVVHRPLVADPPPRVEVEEALVEALHPVLHPPLGDVFGDGHQLVAFADSLADGGGVHPHPTRGKAPL